MLNLRLQSVKEGFDYIMFCDDDLIFPESAEEFLNNVMNVLKNSSPDVLLTRGDNYDTICYNPKNAIIATNRGMFVKVSSIEEFNDDEELLEGGLEESIIAFSALRNKGKLVIMGKSPVTITSKTDGQRHHMSYDSESPIHNLSIVDKNCGEYIRRKYNDPAWKYFSGNFPKGLNYMTNALEKQIGGDHYSKLKIQPVEYCYHNNIPAIEAGVIKYVTRHKEKGGAQDIHKAIHLLEILLKLEYSNDNLA
jgi:hypothetical protein